MNYNNLFKELQVCSEALDKKLAGIDRQLNTLEARLTEMEKTLNEFQTTIQEPEVITEETAVEKSSARKPVVELPSKNAPVAVEEESENGTINNKETADSMPPSNTGEQHKGASFTERASVSAPPVSDIRKAISLGDRFLFQRELFASDGEKMSKTIDILNKMHSLEEATEYIEKHFQWQEDNPATKLFTSILHRRFS